MTPTLLLMDDLDVVTSFNYKDEDLELDTRNYTTTFCFIDCLLS